MPMLSPREAAKVFQVSRATLMKSLKSGKISAEKTDDGHWQIDVSELRRVYPPRSSERGLDRHNIDRVSRDGPVDLDHVSRDDPVDHDLDRVSLRLARVEAELVAEREKVELLQRHLDDVRRLLPAPDAKPRRSWWPW